MSSSSTYQPSRRYWFVLLLMPFATMFLAMVAYVVAHHSLGIPEWQLQDGLVAVPASMLEAIFWVLFIVSVQYLVLSRVYRLDLRKVLLNRALAKSQKTNGVPATLSAIAGFALALALSRMITAADFFSGASSLVFVMVSATNGMFIAPLINLGEERRAERNLPDDEETDK